MVYENRTVTDWTAKRGYKPVTHVRITRAAKYGPNGDERLAIIESGVPVPAPGRVPATTGHWRTSDKSRVRPRKRLAVKPTGGRIERNTGSAPKPPRKRRATKSNTPVTGAAELFAAWENRHNA